MPCRLKSRKVKYPDRDAWLDSFQTRIGASEAPAILGVSSWDSPFSVWCRKTNRVPNDRTETRVQRYGHHNEALAAEYYEEDTGRESFDEGQYTVQYHKKYPFISCTLDRVVHDINRGWGCLNLKALGMSRSDEWQDGPPYHYWVQEQHEMLVTGLKWASLGVMLGNLAFKWCDIERDDTFINDTLLPELCKFWGQVLTDSQPHPDGHPATTRAVNLSAPASDDEKCVELPGEFFHLDQESLELTKQIDVLTERSTAIDNMIKLAIGDATYGLIPGAAQYKWGKRNTRNGGTTRVLTRRSLL